MYAHPATRSNIARLRDDFGYVIVEPGSGPLASGQTGQGRLAETATIVDALVMAAAVADFRPRRAADAKLGRADGLTLELEPTEDILAEASALAHAWEDTGKRRPILVGFAAESGSLERAPEKATRKRVDLLVANDVSEPGSGFGTTTNRVTLITPGQAPEPWPQLTKDEVAHRLLDRILALRA
jgi:phosphopantothenoylcysteine decarboxylase/phosphopantothenate--cysteine ligase